MISRGRSKWFATGTSILVNLLHQAGHRFPWPRAPGCDGVPNLAAVPAVRGSSTRRRKRPRPDDSRVARTPLARPPRLLRDGRCGLLVGTGKAIDVRQLSPDERLELIEQLWDSLSDDERDSLPVTTDHEQELDRRLDALDKEGAVGVPRDELREQLRRRSS